MHVYIIINIFYGYCMRFASKVIQPQVCTYTGGTVHTRYIHRCSTTLLYGTVTLCGDAVVAFIQIQVTARINTRNIYVRPEI